MFFKRLKSLLLLVFFFLFSNFLTAQCHYQIYLGSDSISWCDAYLEVNVNGENIANFTYDSTSNLDSIYSTSESAIEFIFHSGTCDSLINYTIIDPLGDTVLQVFNPESSDTLSIVSNSNCVDQPYCVAADSLVVSEVTSNSGVLSWIQNSPDSVWNLNWGDTGFNQGEGNMINSLTENNFQFSNLASNTSYDFYVQTICDSNNLSEWVGPYSFTTSSTANDSSCYYTIFMYDSYGDGWNGAYLEVSVNDIHAGNYTFDSGDFYLDSVYSYSGALTNFIFHSGNWDSEIFFTIMDPLGDTLISSPAPEDLDNLTHISNSICSAPSCVNPNYLDVFDVTANSALLNWTQNSTDSIWNLNWGPSGFLLGTENLVSNLTNTSLELNNLDNFTSYDFYVQTVCDSNNLSDWSGPFSFTTQAQYGTCGAFIIELTDSYGDGWNGGFIEVQINGSYTDTITIHDGYGPEYFFISVDSGDVVDLLYTEGGWPEENDYNVYDHNGNLIVSQQGVPPSTFGLSACSQCTAPSSLNAYNIDTSSADLIWESYTDSGGIWNIEWGTAGFEIGTGNEVFDCNSIIYSLDGLSANTEYEFYVQELCSNSFLSTWTGPFSFTTSSLPPSPGTCGLYTLMMYDDFGDGWNGGTIDIQVNGNIIHSVFVEDGSGPEIIEFSVDSADIINLIYNEGEWDEENSYELYDQTNQLIAAEDGANSQHDGPASTYGLIACEQPGVYSCGVFTIELYDAYGNGWNNGYLAVLVDSALQDTITLHGGFGPAVMSFGIDSNQTIDLVYHPPIPHSQQSYLDGYRLKDSLGNILVEEIGLDSTGPSSTYQINICQDISSVSHKIDDQLMVYPNPANEILYIETNLKIDKLMITNVLGELVYESYDVENYINISTFSANIYFIRMEINGEIISKKIIVNH